MKFFSKYVRIEEIGVVMKKIYYSPVPGNPTQDELNIPIKQLDRTYPRDITIGRCPAWRHQSSKTFVYTAPSTFTLQILEDGKFYSDNLNEQEIRRYLHLNKNWNVAGYNVLQFTDIFTNFYWTKEKNVWISVLPHPLTSVNNNFYHCGAWFNLSKWSRNVNIGAVIVDSTKPIIIRRGDPLYLIKFHSSNQNDNFEMIQSEIDKKQYDSMVSRLEYIGSEVSADYDYNESIFNSDKPKCPFSFLWKK